MTTISLAAGCSLFNPGGDVRQATEARQETSYDKDSAFTSKESTTHNRRNVVAEGDAVKATFYSDGTPQSIEGATHLMTQSSEPRDAAGAYMFLAQKNAEVGLDALRTVRDLIPLIGAGGGPGPVVATSLSAGVEAILNDPEKLRLLLGRLQPAPPH